MTKHFKSKKKLRHDIIIKYLVILVLSYIIIRLCLVLFLFTPILNVSFKHNKIDYYKNYISNQTINKPSTLLTFYSKKKVENSSQTILANYIINEKPLVYIYNTHQKEAYTDKKTVLDASYLLKEELNKYQVETIVENRDITEFMRTNNISYNYSYYASKFYVSDILSKYKVNLIIDLHRDATSKKVSTVKINNQNYAKVLFVIGKEHKNYKANYALANKLNALIKKSYPSLTRGVILKSGKKVNGIYNQNLSDKNILIEVGGNLNTYSEVNNTIKVLAQVIGDYLHE